MEDRELLELAAKAAGIPEDEAPCYGEDVGIMVRIDGHPLFWNPLKDDGDALRLAVKLRLSVDTFGGALPIQKPEALASWVTRKEVLQVREPFRGDEYAATRRAIVRAAAEIGKGM